MKPLYFKRKLLLSSLLGTAVLASPAWAQQTTGSSSAVRGQIDEILVTAQRRTERLEEVPVFVSVATGEMLERSGITNLENLNRISAGIQVNRGGAFSQPAIRGISTLTLGSGLENNVAVYIDGVYQPDAVAINADLANISSVQILKGPQGTLYGRNATGGAIVIETLAPSDELQGNIQATYARFDDQRLKGYISGPISEKVGFSVAGYWRESDGYIKDIGDDPLSSHDDFDATPLSSHSLRSKLQIEATDNLTISLGYNFVSHLDARGLAYRVTDLAPFYIPADRATARDRVSLNLKPNNRMKIHEGVINVVWDNDLGTLSSTTAYSERRANSIFDFDGTKADIVRAISTGLAQYTLQESINLNIEAIDRWNINVGAMYFHDRFRSDYNTSWAGFVLNQTNDVHLDSEAWAVYVDATWEVVDRLFLTAGGRYSDEDRRGRYDVQNLVGAPIPSADQSRNYSAFTPRFVARYEITDRTNVYASYTQGFRSGTFYSGTQPDPSLYQSVDQEEIDAFEIGFKTAQPAYRLSAAAFYYDYQDLQVGLTVPNPIGSGVVQQIFNAPKAEVYGAEVEADFLVTDHLNARVSVAYVDGEYKDFPGATGLGLDPVTQTNVSPQLQDWSGQQMARAPEWTANIGMDYTTDFAEGVLVLAANVHYSDSYVVQNLSLYGPLAGPELENKQRFRQSAYTTVNAQVDWTDPSGHFTVGVFGENLTDKRYYLSLSGSAMGNTSHYAWPRTYGVRLGYHF